MPPPLRHALIALVVAFAGVVLGCGEAIHAISPVSPHPENEAGCNAVSTCSACVSNVACGWCGDACHAAGDPRATAPASCGAPPAEWRTLIGTCPNVGPASPASPAAPALPPAHG